MGLIHFITGILEARVGIEPTHKGFADLSLTTWVPRLNLSIITKTRLARKRVFPSQHVSFALLFLDGLFQLRLAQESRGLFGRRWIDVETGAPLETRDLGQLGNNFDVPVVVIVDFFADG
jgi:hypothetical protein